MSDGVTGGRLHTRPATRHPVAHAPGSFGQTAFIPSVHGFAFPNWFAPGQPVWGPVRYPGGGVCGGMVFAALDHFFAGTPLPAAEPDELLPHLWRRLLASWDLPFGVARYYDWQRRQARAVARRTLREWPGVRASLDAGRPAPLGLVQADGWGVRRLPLHHQVLAVGYTPGGESAAVQAYDPNWPGDDGVTLTLDLRTGRVTGNRPGPAVRGLFRTRYRPGRLLG